LTERFGIKIEGFENARILTPDEHGKLSSEDEVAVYSDILSLGEIWYLNILKYIKPLAIG